MIYTITVNPCLDVLRFIRHDREGGLLDGTYRPDDPNKDERQRPGGKGIDVSRALACLRTDTLALGFCGDATGSMLRGLLDAEGISNDFVDIGVETRTNIILFLVGDDNAVKHEIRINSKGKEVPPNRYVLLYEKCADITNAAGLAVSGSLCFEMQDTFYNALIRNIRKNNSGCVVVLDGPERATAEAMSLKATRPDYIKPNLSEFDALLRELSTGNRHLCSEFPDTIGSEKYLEYLFTGATVAGTLEQKWRIDKAKLTKNWLNLIDHVRFIRDDYGVQTLLSLGPLGCCTVAAGENEFLHAYIPTPCKPRTRVGAGDCLVAGFLSEFVKKRDLDGALRAGVAAASARLHTEESSVGKYLDAERFRELHDQVRIDKYTEQDVGSPKFLEIVDSSMIFRLDDDQVRSGGAGSTDPNHKLEDVT